MSYIASPNAKFFSRFFTYWTYAQEWEQPSTKCTGKDTQQVNKHPTNAPSSQPNTNQLEPLAARTDKGLGTWKQA